MKKLGPGNPTFIRNQNTLIAGCIVQIALLVFVILVSKFKPWTRRRELSRAH